MSLRLRRFICWGCFALSVLGLSLGSTLYWHSRLYSPADPFSEIGVISTTIVVRGEETSIGGSAAATRIPETAPAVAVESLLGQYRQAQAQLALARWLLICGGIPGLAFLFILPQRKAGPGVEVGWLAAALAPGRSGNYMAMTGDAMAAVVLSALYAAALLLGLRLLAGWLLSRCRMDWLLAHRAGMLLSGGMRRPQHYLAVTGGFALLCCALALLTWTNSFPRVSLQWWLRLYWGLPLVLFGTLAFVQMAHCGRYMRRVLDMVGQIAQDIPVSAAPGPYESWERELEQLQRSQREAIEQARVSERFKVELISNVSHDLRTPLTSILGYGELLTREKLTERGEQQLAALNGKARYMKELVEELFELTKVSSGAVESRREPLDMIRLLEQTAALMEDELAGAKLTLKRAYCADSLPVVTDGARMHRVFANLLGNAVKYGLAGTRVFLTVQDAGECIAVRLVNTANYEMDFVPEDMLRRFARGDKARTGPGSGLGLAIAQTYTESVGGSFSVAVDGDQFSASVTLPKADRNL